MIVGAAALTAAAYFGARWLFTDADPTGEAGLSVSTAGTRKAAGNAIPLTLPPPPASYSAGTPSADPSPAADTGG